MEKLLTVFLIFCSSFLAVGRDSIIGPQWTGEKSFTNWLEEHWLPLKDQLLDQETETIILSFMVNEQGEIGNLSLSMKSWEQSNEMTNLIAKMLPWISASWNGDNISTIVYTHILIGSKVPENNYRVDPAAHICLWNEDYITAHKVYTSDFSWSGIYSVRMISDPQEFKPTYNADLFQYVSRAPLYDSITLECLEKYGKSIIEEMNKREGMKDIRKGVLQFWVNTKGEIYDVLLSHSNGEYFSIPSDFYSSSVCNLKLMKIQGNPSPTVWSLKFK